MSSSLYIHAGLVAEAMAVQVPTTKAVTAPTTRTPNRSFWRLPFFGHNKTAYKALKDVDSPDKKPKGSRADETDEASDDVPLLKAGGLTSAKYAEKLGRHAEEEEPFVPRPHSRITFKLPDTDPTDDKQSKQVAEETATTEARVPDVATPDLTSVVDLIPAKDITTASGMSPANDVAPAPNVVPAIDMLPANEAVPADEAKKVV